MVQREGFDIQRYYDLAQVIYGNQAHEGELHRIPLTEKYLNHCFTVAGFQEGKMGTYYKGVKSPKMGEFTFHKKFIKKGAVLRNDTIFAEVIK
jgi:hypothetical protein